MTNNTMEMIRDAKRKLEKKYEGLTPKEFRLKVEADAGEIIKEQDLFKKKKEIAER